jgi:hypothetical protein
VPTIDAQATRRTGDAEAADAAEEVTGIHLATPEGCWIASNNHRDVEDRHGDRDSVRRGDSGPPDRFSRARGDDRPRPVE